MWVTEYSRIIMIRRGRIGGLDEEIAGRNSDFMVYSASRSYSRSQSRRSGYSRSRKHSSDREEIERVERIKEDVAEVVRESEYFRKT